MLPDLPEPSDFVLDDVQREAVLDVVIETLNQYVFPEVAAQLQQDIQERRQAEGYQDITGSEQLADILTGQLQTLSGDRQLKVHFSPQPLPDLSPNQAPSPESLAAEKARSSLRNFDINRVERLRGNVGYLELYGFEPPDLAGDVLAAAMTFVAQTQALIIDLRHNRGGSPAMVALLCSYLLPVYPPVHLNNVYWRPNDTTRQWWTAPHLPAPHYHDKPVYVLTSEQTFSAAEEFAYNLQVLKRAIVVGEHTPGGANPGQGYRLGDHFWMFVPTGQTINPITGSNWAKTGVIPDVKVPAELSLLTAHAMALNTLLETAPEGAHFRELQRSMLIVERELNAQRADLISQLKQPNPGNSQP
ncbi:MAG: S41 family peptidase [Leptolyngbya sp. SIO1D8]|nr:S41 family peptidase [Leptolyngbya sp. SIO1D8]